MDEEDSDYEWILLSLYNVSSSISRAATSRNCNALGSRVASLSHEGIKD